MADNVADTYGALAKTPNGRDVLWDILSECGVYTLSYGPNGVGAEFNDGRRSIGLHILGRLNESDPGIYPKMIIEREKNGR